MSPLTCMQEDNPARSLYWKGASTARCTNSSQVSGTPQQWVCDGVSVFLIDTETCLRKAAKPHIRTLRGDFFLPPPSSFLSFPFLSFPETGSFFFPQQEGCWWWYHYSPPHYWTLHHGARSNSFSRLLLSVSPTGGALPYKVLKAHKFCRFNESTFWVGCLAASCVCCQYFFRAPYQDRSSVLPKCLKAQNDTEWERTPFISAFESSAQPSTCFIKVGKSQHSEKYLFSEEEQSLLPLLFLPFPSSLAVKTNGASFASWQDASLLW